MSTVEPFRLSCEGSTELAGFLHLPDRPGARPGVVVAHGFKGFMEWGFFPYLADLLCERGLAVVRFNFSGTGMQPGDETVTDLEAFRDNTIRRERDELLAVLEAFGVEVGEGRVDRDRLAVVGHSRGGGDAILTAAVPPWDRRLRALVTWAAVGTYERWDAPTRERWRRDGELRIVNGRTGQELPLGLGLLDEIEQHGDEIDPLRAAARRRAPWLILHGRADPTVPVDEAVRLQAAAAPPRELRILGDADHTFGAKHPFAGPNPHLTEAMNATQTWLLRYLGEHA